VRTVEQGGRRIVREVRIVGDSILGDDIHRVANRMRQIIAAEQAPDQAIYVIERPPPEIERASPLGRPTDDDGGDFYERLAARYEKLAKTSHRPSALIGRMEGVPVTTVHRWIATARRKGLLPPARKGAAG
jgi:hypothetical protein